MTDPHSMPTTMIAAGIAVHRLHVDSLIIKHANVTLTDYQKKKHYVVDDFNLACDAFDFTPDPALLASMSLNLLHQFRTQGEIQVKRLGANGTGLDDIRLQFSLSDKALTLSPVSYALHGAKGSALLSLTFDGDKTSFRLKNHLPGVNLAHQGKPSRQDQTLSFSTMPLLLDIQSGTMDATTDLWATVHGDEPLDKHLNGSVRLEVKKGLIRRFNLSYELQRLEDRIRRVEPQPKPTQMTTAFDRFYLNLLFNNGVAKNFPIVLEAPDFRFSGKGRIDFHQDPAWMTLNVLVKPAPGKFKKLEHALNKYLADYSDGSLPVTFTGPVYTPNQIAVKVDQTIARKLLEDFLEHVPDLLRDKLINKLEYKLKKSLVKMQKRLNGVDDY